MLSPIHPRIAMRVEIALFIERRCSLVFNCFSLSPPPPSLLLFFVSPPLPRQSCIFRRFQTIVQRSRGM